MAGTIEVSASAPAATDCTSAPGKRGPPGPSSSFDSSSIDRFHRPLVSRYPSSPMIGTTLSHYRILEPLGAGGMGEVYRAHDLHLERDVAVKVLLRGSLAEPTARERFRREAHVLSRFSHPGVATIFDFDTQDGVDFLVMEHVP